MGITIVRYWDRLRSSFWFVPGTMAIGAVGLSFGTVWLDEMVTEKWVRGLGWIYSGGAAGASAVLGTIASSMMTITGLVFSMTLVALSLASTQFGPRLLRNFMRATANQVVLGTFVATFLYCLLVLRTIRRADELLFVPHISVTLGVVFALFSLGVLIYFIHHVAVSIQADEIIARVSAELDEGIERLYPVRIGEAAEEGGTAPAAVAGEGKAIPATGDGYVQVIDGEALIKAAKDADVVLRIDRRPGHYVVRGAALAHAWPAERVKDELAKAVQGAYGLGVTRTPNQDVEFALLELVEIAVRALSPGINDPFTAMTCVDRLSSALSRLAEREPPANYRKDEKGDVRVIAAGAKFSRLMAAAFDQIRQNARGNVAVTIRMLEALEAIAGATRRREDRDAVLLQADMIAQRAREEITEGGDRRAVDERSGRVTAATERRAVGRE